jgi:hypothetical protein
MINKQIDDFIFNINDKILKQKELQNNIKEETKHFDLHSMLRVKSYVDEYFKLEIEINTLKTMVIKL